MPQTDFPMRGNLAEREPEIVKFWSEQNIYAQLRQQRASRPTFILHEGPPFANGHIHIGHALNRILKDIIVRSQSMLGKNAPVIPGWDCHGLPIEWKIEEAYREKGVRKEDVDVNVFRKECESFAKQWIATQSEELQRLGLLQDWENYYTTMNPQSEALIIQTLGRFLMSGSLYRGFKPVMWSVVEKTALAEAEIEYKDHTSASIYVGFPVVESSIAELAGTKIVIWTTTPWTLPANRAIAYHKRVNYCAIEVQGASEGALVAAGERLVMAEDLLDNVASALKITNFTTLATFSGADLEKTICAHPWRGQGYNFDVPLLPADYVTTDTGTGFVHTAPSHGPDDFLLGLAHNLEVPDLVAEDGVYRDTVPLFHGQHIFKVEGNILDSLKGVGALLAYSKIQHSYPHSWRSKAPVIYRATPQWFVSMDRTSLRKEALSAIESVRWIPESGQRRLASMLENRPDWCISRQRIWGVPLTLFVHKKTGEVLRDKRVHDRIIEAVRLHGCSMWFSADPAQFLAPEYAADEYEPVYDIIDVWFESGSSQVYVLEHTDGQSWPADVYCEGSDQHRGWFQSSLFIGCETKQKAPFKTVLTHGFTLDDKGQKMSKSLGNVVSPLEIAQSMGVDILRLWVANSDVTDDVRVGPETLKHQQDIYRRFRNTLRYLLGALHGYQNPPVVQDVSQFPKLEQYMLHKLYCLNEDFISATESYGFLGFYNAVHNFCANDLSSFYFDIRKDRLYCDALDSADRQATLFVMNAIFEHLIRWLAPVLCFTAEEAWQHRHKTSSVHLQEIIKTPQIWKRDDIGNEMDSLREYRRVVTGALEAARTSGLIGSSLQAQVNIYDPTKLLQDGDLWSEFAIVSRVSITHEEPPAASFRLQEIPDIAVTIQPAKGTKCERCWKVTEDVGVDESFPSTCHRCSQVLARAC